MFWASGTRIHRTIFLLFCVWHQPVCSDARAAVAAATAGARDGNILEGDCGIEKIHRSRIMTMSPVQALLSNAFAWMRKASEDGLDGMVALLQKVSVSIPTSVIQLPITCIDATYIHRTPASHVHDSKNDIFPSCKNCRKGGT